MKKINIKDLNEITGGSNNWTTAYNFSNEIPFSDIKRHPEEIIYVVDDRTKGGIIGGKNWFAVKFKKKEDKITYINYIVTVVDPGKTYYLEGTDLNLQNDGSFKYYLTRTE